MIKKFIYIHSLGIMQIINILFYKISQRKITKDFNLNGFIGKLGLEIGGPSAFFKSDNICPIYGICDGLDNINFSTATKWEGKISSGETFLYNPNKKKGIQYVMESSNLACIPDSKYDFILACHSLEHNANVIKTLKEWYRVLKSNGQMLIVLPDRKFTFDKYREFTTFEHILEDEKNDVQEDDDTHFNEVLEKHYLIRDIEQKCKASFRNWVVNNYNNRGVHHHVFSESLIFEIANYLNLKVEFSSKYPPHHLVFLLKK
jgi:predicted SAM-dependent methyltransferase